MQLTGKNAILTKFAFILVAPIVIYWQDLFTVFQQSLLSDFTTHILAIPILLIYVLFRSKDHIYIVASDNNTETSSSIRVLKDVSGLLVCVLALLIRWIGTQTFYPLEYRIGSLPIFMIGLIVLIFNYKTLRALAFPIVLLAFLIPPPIAYAQLLGSALSSFSSRTSYAILTLIRIPVTLSTSFGSPVILLIKNNTQIPFTIDLACSGLYSIMGFTLFATFIAYIATGPTVKKISILFLGIPTMALLNVLRITLIILIGHTIGISIALDAFHLLGGWFLIFSGTLFLLYTSEKYLGIKIITKTQEICSHDENYVVQNICLNCDGIIKPEDYRFTRNDAVRILLISLLIFSLIFIQIPVLSLSEGVPNILLYTPSGDEYLLDIFPNVSEYELRFVRRDTEFETVSGQDASLVYQYYTEDNSKPSIWVMLEIGSSMINLHHWESCLITWPETHGKEAHVTQLDLRDIQLSGNPPIIARYFAYQGKESNLIQVILYWFTRSMMETDTGKTEKILKTSLIIYTEDINQISNLENTLHPIADTITSKWNPITKWSWLALAIAANGIIFIPITAGIISIIIIIQFYHEYIKMQNAKKMIHNIKDKKTLNIIKSINILSKKESNITNIEKKYRDITGIEIEKEDILQWLLVAEKMKIIKRKYNNLYNKTFVTWRLRARLPSKNYVN